MDISARGRHLNLTLFGAQQFRSKVDDEVVGNAATSLYGRIGDEELTNSAYRSFSSTTRDELLQLDKGQPPTAPRPLRRPGLRALPPAAGPHGQAGDGHLRRPAAGPGDPPSWPSIRSWASARPAIATVRSDIEGVPVERSTRPSTPSAPPTAPATAPPTRTRTLSGTSSAAPSAAAATAATPPRYSPGLTGSGTRIRF